MCDSEAFVIVMKICPDIHLRVLHVRRATAGVARLAGIKQKKNATGMD